MMLKPVWIGNWEGIVSVITQVFNIWRTSVLLTVGALSLGAEQLENSVKGLIKSDRTDRAPRVKVPVRAGKVETSGTARSRAVKQARVAKKAVAKAAAKAATVKASGARKVRVKAAHVPEATVAEPSTAQVETLVSEASAN